MKEKDDIKATDRKLLCCYRQAQQMTDESRPEIKRKWVFPGRKKSTGTCKEILHEGVQLTVSNREQTRGQWVDRNKTLLDAEDDNTFRPRDTSVY
jgi:hypothetical protein